MGLFNYVRCDAPLPGGLAPAPDEMKCPAYQTKDEPPFTELMMNTLAITADGRLLYDDSREQDGATSRVLAYHGDLYFYNTPDEQYIARFSEGRLMWIKRADEVG